MNGRSKLGAELAELEQAEEKAHGEYVAACTRADAALDARYEALCKLRDAQCALDDWKRGVPF